VPTPDEATLVDIPTALGGGRGTRLRARFGTPARWIVARAQDEVAAVIDAAHAAALAGAWCVGWVCYEAAPGLNATLAPDNHVHTPRPESVLAAFAVFDAAQPWPDSDPTLDEAYWDTGPWGSELLPVASSAEETSVPPAFGQRVEHIRSRIRAGDVYQVNLTTQLASALRGDDLAYFDALRRSQPRGYVFRIAHALDGVPERILSVSPELFFRWDAGRVTTQPMKGTAPRGASPGSDEAAAAALRASDKERAENLMIVDLMRNDLSRVARLGSVRVPQLFELHALPTVWQMTSTITAETRAGLRLSELFSALFPCGSVTGAPKRFAMSIIRQLETEPRGVYCGAIGLLQPGGAALFNVPIRTVTLRAEAAVAASGGPSRWQARCGVGSGITFDSRADAEAREWRDKQGFLQRAARPFELLETLRLEDGQYWLLDRHLARLQRSAAHFGYPMDREHVTAALDEAASLHAKGLYRARLLVSATGRVRVEAAQFVPTPEPVRLAWASRPMALADEFVRHKTTRREAYTPFAPAHAPGGGAPFDTLLWNRDGRITETTFGNIALRIGGEWLTPATDAGLLPGVYREALLEDGRIREAALTVDDMAHADGAAFLNSVRGWLEVDWLHLVEQWRAWRSGSGQAATPRP
jgi:para-aminobenzoate synthetase/4-amino-4-deoxychorismate lyase